MSKNILNNCMSCARKTILNVFFCVITIGISPLSSSAAERLIDTIIATVDEIPITLVELGARIFPPRTLTVEQIQNDETLKKALDALILEKLLIAEAERKNIKVLDDDITRYIEEVKKKNNLDDQEFTKALQAEGQSMAAYKDRIRTEILKSRVASASIKNTTAVTDEEIDNFIKNRVGQQTSSGRKTHLKKISLIKADYSKEEATALAAELLAADEPSNFVTDLGFVSENDLSDSIKTAIRPVGDGSISEPLDAQGYWDFFQVIERQDASETSDEEAEEMPKVDDTVRAQIKQRLEQEKLQKKMELFIDQELPNLHTIDKKI